MNVREFILKSFDKEYENNSVKELSKAPVYSISGVSHDDASSLKNAFGITTVEDLATNKYIQLAQAINMFSKHSGKILDKEFNSAEFEELRKKPISAISGVSESDAVLLKNAFGINTIQDMAENKQIEIAQMVTVIARLFETAESEQKAQQVSLPEPPQTAQPSQSTETQHTLQSETTPTT